MTVIIDYAASRARMVLAFIIISLVAGGISYSLLPKEGEPDVEIPVIFISVPFPGISAEDSERLLVKPMETELSDLDGLSRMTSTAAEGYAGVALEFEFDWDKSQTLADIRNRMNNAEAGFPQGAENHSINEVVFSEFPIMIVNLAGAVPERTLRRLAKDMQERLENLEPVLEATLGGHRDEMLEVVIDPLRLEAYDVTVSELINVVASNNQLIAAGEVETDQGAFSVKIPASYGDYTDVYELPIKVDGDRVVKLGELAEIRLAFADRVATARYNGVSTLAFQVVKRKGFNLIETAQLVRDEVEAERQTWPAELRKAVEVSTSNDRSYAVASMINQLESSVLTAIALVMIVVLAALGPRAALLVGFAIPTSFLLCFAFLAIMGVAVSNMVMFGLICGDADLPVDVGRRFYQFFTVGTNLPLDKTYGEIAKAVSKETSTLDIAKLQASGVLGNSGAKDLVTEIARSWFTGVVRISGAAGGREERITYFDALMYRASLGYRNIPTTCGGEFGWWAFEPSPDNRCCGDAWAKDEKNPKWGGRVFPENVGGQVGKDEQQ